jgi:tetratricopeptide (TPR) repeat protein
LSICQERVQLGQKHADLEIECNGLCTQGGVQRRLGHLDEAIAVLNRSIELADAIPDFSHRIGAGGDLGRCFLRQGQFDEALSVLQVNLQVYVEHGTGWGTNIPLFNGLAEGYLMFAEQCRQEEKDDWLRKAKNACGVALKKSKAYRPGLPEAMRLQGSYEWLRGSTNEAHKWWQRSLFLSEKMGQRYDLGMVHLELGRWLGDRAHLEKAEAIFSEIEAAWDLARAREALGKL